MVGIASGLDTGRAIEPAEEEREQETDHVTSLHQSMAGRTALSLVHQSKAANAIHRSVQVGRLMINLQIAQIFYMLIVGKLIVEDSSFLEKKQDYLDRFLLVKIH